jgi:hypothetical protein
MERFGQDDLNTTHNHPYLNRTAIGEVERLIAAEVMKIPGIACAQTRSDLLEGRISNAPLQVQIRRNFHPVRSGNIHMIQEHYWFLHLTDDTAIGIEFFVSLGEQAYRISCDQVIESSTKTEYDCLNN